MAVVGWVGCVMVGVTVTVVVVGVTDVGGVMVTDVDEVVGGVTVRVMLVFVDELAALPPFPSSLVITSAARTPATMTATAANTHGQGFERRSGGVGWVGSGYPGAGGCVDMRRPYCAAPWPTPSSWRC